MNLRRLPAAGMSHGNGSSHGSQGGHSAFGPNSVVAAAMSQFANVTGGPTVLHPHQQTPTAMASPWMGAVSNNNACRMNDMTSQIMAVAQSAGIQLTPAAAAATANFMSLSAQVITDIKSAYANQFDVL